MAESASFAFTSSRTAPSSLHHIWWRRLREKARHGLLSYYLQGRLADRGLKICPFVLFREACVPAPVDLPTDLAVHRLSAEDRRWLATLARETGLGVRAMEERLHEGELGFVLLRHGDPVAMVWSSLRSCHNEMLPGTLEPSEAYSYDLWTARPARGRGYAAILKRAVLAELGRMGRRWCVSVVDQLNRPSLRCKAKLNASVGGYFLHLRWARGRRTYALPLMAESWF